MTDNMARRVIGDLGIGSLFLLDARILDLGCGIGGTARLLAGLYAGVRVTGRSHDLQPPGRDCARPDYGRRPIRPRHVRGRRLYRPADAARGRAMGAFSIESVCHAPAPDKAEFVREAARILKPGGRRWWWTASGPSSRPLYPLLERAYDHWRAGSEVPGLGPHPPLRARSQGQRVPRAEDRGRLLAGRALDGVRGAQGVRPGPRSGWRRGGSCPFRQDSTEWMIGFSAAFLGLNKHAFGYYAVSATRA